LRSVDDRLGLVEQPQLVAVGPLARRAEALALEQPDVLAQLRDLAVALRESNLARFERCIALREHAIQRNHPCAQALDFL
jgi:hypothetical protein